MIEQDIESTIEARNEALPSLRELGPPDLVHLIKQSAKSGGRQVRSFDAEFSVQFLANGFEQSGVYHHVTGIDASSSASLAAYINTLTQASSDKISKVVSGTYWYIEFRLSKSELD